MCHPVPARGLVKTLDGDTAAVRILSVLGPGGYSPETWDPGGTWFKGLRRTETVIADGRYGFIGGLLREVDQNTPVTE